MIFNTKNIPQNKEDFTKALEERIVSGKLAAGTRLPTEREFSEQTGIGKSAIHAAVMELERKGFVDIVPRKGAYVADFAKTGTIDTLSEVLRCNGGKLSFDMSVNIVQLRNAIEGGALLRLAENHTDDDIKKLRTALDKLRQADIKTIEVPEIAALERGFHMLICELSGNSMFSLVLNSFMYLSAAIWQYCALFWGLEGFIAHDEALIDMIERGEGNKAREYIEDIFAQFLDAFFKND